MIIAAAAKGAELETIIPEKYEDASHLLVVETDTMETVACYEKQDEFGVNFINALQEHWAEAIVCGKIPWETFVCIADLGVSRYNGGGLSVKDGLKGAEDNSLPLMVKD